MKSLRCVSLALLVGASPACTKKIPALELAQSQTVPDPTEEPPETELRIPESKKAVAPPTFNRVDEDTLLVQGQEISVVRGTDVASTPFLEAGTQALVAKDNALFIVKSPVVLEAPDLDSKSVAEGLMLQVEAAPGAEMMIVASSAGDGDESLCLALKGRDAGRFVALDTAECWSTRDDLSKRLSASSHEDSLHLLLKGPEFLASLKDYPILKVQLKPATLEKSGIAAEPSPSAVSERPLSSGVEETLPASDGEATAEPAKGAIDIADSSGEKVEPLPQPPIAEVIVEGPPDATDGKDIIESLPVILAETMASEVEEVLAKPNLGVDERDSISQLQDRSKKAQARYKEKKQRLRELRQERNQARESRKADRAKLAKDKSSEQKLCKRKKASRCTELAKEIKDKVEKDLRQTKQISEMKEQMEAYRVEALEDLKELRLNQSEIKSFAR